MSQRPVLELNQGFPKLQSLVSVQFKEAQLLNKSSLYKYKNSLNNKLNKTN